MAKVVWSKHGEQIEELDRSHVHMRDRDHVMNTLIKMGNDGRNKLQVVADFDRTLSKYMHHENICATCHQVLEEGEMPEVYKQKTFEIREKYLPIEKDPNMTIEEKIPYMIEWWTQMHELLIKYPVSKNKLHDMVAASTAKLRDGCKKLFDTLNRCDVPLLIFSAGIGDIIRELITQQASCYNNMHFVSNDLDFDENDEMKGFKGNIIHLFNKNENAVHDSDYFSNLSHCSNVLLMGDSLGDLQMANGAENVESKLTIGFLNFGGIKNYTMLKAPRHKKPSFSDRSHFYLQVTDRLELYKSKYDIVVCEDETLDIVNAILNQIIGTDLF